MTMTATQEFMSETGTLAEISAARNWAANIRALRATQPCVAGAIDGLDPHGIEWVFGRDGALTVLEAAGGWWNGCSMPARAAQFMFRDARLSGRVVCFLCADHAAQIRVVLDQLEAPQAIIALMPDARALRVLLGCGDFSQDLAAHRLWFAWGEEWAGELHRLLDENPGLPTPTEFVRPIFADSSAADALVTPAQTIFAEQSDHRIKLARAATESWRPRALASVCLIAPSHFRLWDDAGNALAGAMCGAGGVSVVRYDPDDPVSASPAALATSAARCDALLSPNSGRGDLPEVASMQMPWVTWVTTPRIPSSAKAGPRDALLLADPAWERRAIDAGWDPSRIAVAGWPADVGTEAGGESRAGALALIVDTLPLDPPTRVMDFSSHRLLWEAIREQLLADPFALGDDAGAYLANQLRDAKMSDEGFDRPAFLHGLVLPAWAQGLARMLIKKGTPPRLHGRGWDQIDEFTAHARGAVESREQLRDIARWARSLVCAWPSTDRHPIDIFGRPVVRAMRGRKRFFADIDRALSSLVGPPAPCTESLSMDAITRVLAPI